MSNRYGYSDKIAHELWKKSLVIDLRRVSNPADWDDLSAYASEEVMEKVDPVIDAIYAAGLAIVKADDLMRAEVERLRAALQSIARSTCCNRCNEAALIARNALKEDGR